MNYLKRIGCILAVCMVLFITVAPAMAAEGDVRVIDTNGNDVTGRDDEITDNNGGLKPEDIYSDNKVLGQDVKSGEFTDFINVKKWLNLIFVNDYISAIAGLVFAIVGLVIIFGSGLSILTNAAKMVFAMLSIDGDVDEKVEKVHEHEKSTLTLMRGLGVTFICMSVFCFMITFFG